MEFADQIMEPCLPKLHAIQLPPMDARITPPPEEMSPISSANTLSLVSDFPEGMSESTHSGASTPNTLSKKRSRRRTSSSDSRPQLRVLKPLPQQNTNLVFSPRPYENVYHERAYLTGSLQDHSSRAAGLIREYSSIQARLGPLETGKERRRLKKKLSLLKGKINEAVEQEKAIFVRLGELYVEVQSRETWAQADRVTHQRSYSWDGYTTSTPSAYGAMSPMSCGMPTPTTPLNAMSPAFVPGGYFGGYFGDAWQTAEPAIYHQPEVTSPIMGLETVDEAGEEMLYSPGMPCEYDTMEEVQDTYQRRVSCDMSMVPMRERRLSLPCLQNVWPETST